ncbi:hypothetical protein BS47DRAFT_1481984 [Hydnum rufescens UP504]|uniref:Isochorismatase-like domain-containing protein n=1 Tax=Hydnum rufescens UP504 TaxID=1448309 RepID=A0A9P6B883_9AGAM|nr:hypothetical protein BS47DRAFT_1481984 [Hydnum rufescens UP504]
MSEFPPLGPGKWEFPGEAGDDTKRPVALFICDLQPRFNAVANFDRVVMTGAKMVKAAKILKMGIVVSEQRPEVFGATVPGLGLDDLGLDHNIVKFSKGKFSMVVPEVEGVIAPADARLSVVIVGIEAHICVLQTALDLLRRQVEVYVLADGVSSINKEEVPIALERIRQAGGVVTTSESFLFQVMRDSSRPEFREFAKLVKDTKGETQETLKALLPW